ncbi:uncharacterized protein TNCV_2696331 [Trichonephila clavipes]|nr:uncharacterized protein TNCV_2696331 [Trichonephila clavipes]
MATVTRLLSNVVSIILPRPRRTLIYQYLAVVGRINLFLGLPFVLEFDNKNGVLTCVQHLNAVAIAEWYRYWIGAGFVTSLSPIPVKTRRVGQRCTLNLSRAETSSRWCGVVVRRGGVSSGVVHVT